jgi:acyl transferase domain-containing protein
MTNGIAGQTSQEPVFVFSGQGSQWVGMGRQLFVQEPVFRTAIEKCDTCLRKYVSWSLLEELQADQMASRLHETQIAQPALFAMQVALTALWRSWGIEPGAVVGHSVGEIAAAYVAGVLELEDAVQIVAHRGALMQQAQDQGYMVAAGISETQAEELLTNYSDRVAIAAINSPGSVVLSGDTQALDEVLNAAKMQPKPFLFRRLNVDYAFHSPQMKKFQTVLVEKLQAIKGARQAQQN